MRQKLLSCGVAALIALTVSGCVTTGSTNDPIAQPATLVPDTKTGVVLDHLPAPVRPLDVSVYNFPDLTGQNKPNDNFAEFSRALTQGGGAILIDVLTKAGGGQWFTVVERNDLQPLLQERQIIQNTRTAAEGKKAPSLPPLRFAGVILEGGIVGYDADETSGGMGATYLGIGGDTQYRQDIITVALRAVSVQTGRVLASVTTTKTIYSTLVHGSAFQFAAIDHLLQAEFGVTKNSPATLAVREGIQLAVYSLIFEGVKKDLWQFKDRGAGDAFMRELDRAGTATTIPASVVSQASLPISHSAAAVPVSQVVATNPTPMATASLVSQTTSSPPSGMKSYASCDPRHLIGDFDC